MKETNLAQINNLIPPMQKAKVQTLAFCLFTPIGDDRFAVWAQAKLAYLGLITRKRENAKGVERKHSLLYLGIDMRDFSHAKLFFAFGHAHAYLSAFAYLVPKKH